MIDGSPEAPVVGWRLWRRHGRELHSWGLDYLWSPGPNQARCLSGPGRGCPHPPGRGCHCGFWAIWDPIRCLLKAREDGFLKAVLGLMAGWGTIALHGDEGFRAERARIVCLFRDPVGHAVPRRLLDERPHPRPINRLYAGGLRRVPPPGGLALAAADHGVPLLWLTDALSRGVLSELGAPPTGLRAIRSRV